MVKKSEYSRNFKTASHQKNIPSYIENVEYRANRRERECAHTPLAWDTEWKDSSPSICSDEAGEVSSDDGDIQPAHQKSKPDIEHDDKHCKPDKNQRTDLEKLGLINLEDDTKDEDEQIKTQQKRKQNGISLFYKKSREPVKSKTMCISKRPRRPDRYRSIPKPRPFSSPVCRPLKKDNPAIKPPFTLYAQNSSRSDIGAQNTFNIKASTHVAPAALSASKRREAHILRLKLKEKDRPKREKINMALFNDKLLRETSSWDTEYSNHFVGYENSMYARNMHSARNLQKPPPFN